MDKLEEALKIVLEKEAQRFKNKIEPDSEEIEPASCKNGGIE